jgi:hypothetical protein
MHLYAAFMAGKRKVKYASEMPIFKIAFEERGKNKKGPQGLLRSVMK